MATAGASDGDDPIRQVRLRLEALRRAGVDRIPRPPLVERPIVAAVAESPARPTEVRQPQPTRVLEPPQRPAESRPSRPVREEVARPIPMPSRPVSLFQEPEEDLGPVIDVPLRPPLLEVIRAEVEGCTRCDLLASTRTQTVFGEGSLAARLMFLGEAPGADEDRTGRPFVGKAGQLLTDMITKGMGLSRDQVYIANMLKCRPPGNRDPQPDEVAHCRGYLERQIALIRPEFLCLLGRIAAQALLETALPLGRLRGRWHSYRGIPAIVTYHPAYLLRNPEGKRDAWEDLKMLMTAMKIPPPERRQAGD